MRWLKRSMGTASILAVALTVAAGPALCAVRLRSPQVVFNYSPLQAFLNTKDTAINCATDQLDGQLWSTAIAGYDDMTLWLETGLGPVEAFGFYNIAAPVGPIPPLFQVFPSGAAAGSFALLRFGNGNLVVTLFDENAVFLGRNVYSGVTQTNFGFYFQGPCGTYFSQDSRNAPVGTQMLTYNSNLYPGDFWLAWEACTYQPAATFNAAVIYIDNSQGDPFPTPTVPTTWGRMKSMYRK